MKFVIFELFSYFCKAFIEYFFSGICRNIKMYNYINLYIFKTIKLADHINKFI